MSSMYGKWNLDGVPIDPVHLQQVADLISPYGPNGRNTLRQSNAGMIYSDHSTTREEEACCQSYVTTSGAVLMWDGRLDNREELMECTAGPPARDAADVQIVASCLGRFGTKCLGGCLAIGRSGAYEPGAQRLCV